MKISMFFKSQLMCVMSLIFATLFAKADHTQSKECIFHTDGNRFICVGDRGWFRWNTRQYYWWGNRYFLGTVEKVQSTKSGQLLVNVDKFWLDKNEYIPEGYAKPKEGEKVTVSISDSHWPYDPNNAIDTQCIHLIKTNIKICVNDCVYGYRWTTVKERIQRGLNSYERPHEEYQIGAAKVLAIRKQIEEVYYSQLEHYFVLLDFGNHSYFRIDITPDRSTNQYNTIFTGNSAKVSCPTSGGLN